MFVTKGTNAKDIGTDNIFTASESLLKEIQRAKIDYRSVTQGFCRLSLNKHVHSNIVINQQLSDKITSICFLYVNEPFLLEPEKDDINHITNQDFIKCEELRQKGNNYFKTRQYENAIICYNAALKKNPNNYLIYANRGLGYQLTNNPTEAMQDIQQTIKLAPWYVKGWYRLGLLFLQKSDYTMAAVAFYTGFAVSVKWDVKQINFIDNYLKYKIKHYSKMKKNSKNENINTKENDDNDSHENNKIEMILNKLQENVSNQNPCGKQFVYLVNEQLPQHHSDDEKKLVKDLKFIKKFDKMAKNDDFNGMISRWFEQVCTIHI